jgi:hypothetical protein
METVQLERTLVKSPPELWEELASDPGISRWLGAIEVAGQDAPNRLEWSGQGARGVIELEPSGWGTKVRASASIDPQPRWGRLLGRSEDPDIEQRLEHLLDDLGASSLSLG